MTNKQVKQTRKTNRTSKQDKIIKLLKRPKGASLNEIAKASAWQEHSVQGFISGTCKRKLQLNVESSKDDKGVRRYRIVEGSEGVSQEADAGAQA